MKKTLFLFTLIIVCTTICAQNQKDLRINRYKAWAPIYIMQPKGSPNGKPAGLSWQQWCESLIKKGDLGEDTKTAWVVYSDRNDNRTYLTPSYDNRSTVTLSFGQQLYVAEIKDGFARVFTDERAQDNYPKINSSAQFLGWVPIENLLLWQTCPKNSHEIFQKALVVYDAKSDVDADPYYLLNPDRGTKSEMKSLDLDILFVMKTCIAKGKTYYLLSNQMNIIQSVRSDLYGWLPSELITPWDQRLVLEPTYHSNLVIAYKEKDLKPVTFLNLEDAEKYYHNGTMDNAFSSWNLERNKRLDPDMMRYPIIAPTENDHIFKVAVMKGDEGDGYQRNRAEIQRNINKLTKQQQNINVIFVIDATSSMKDFFPAIAKALKDVMGRQFFTNPETKSSIRVGCVLYRDYKDQKRTNGIEYRPLTRDLESISSYLTQVNPYSSDADDYEAMFDGIETALDYRKMDYEPDQSNFIVLIGDAGNHRKDLKNRGWKEVSTVLAGLMYQNKINFIAYQINNKGSEAYDDFCQQVTVMQRTLTKHYSDKLKVPMKYRRTRQGEYTAVRESTEATDLPIYNMYKYQNVGKSESALDMTNEIVNKIEEFYKQVSEEIVLLQRSSSGGFKLNSMETSRTVELLRLGGYSETTIEHYLKHSRENGGVTKFLAYAPEKIESTQSNIYSYVLFFSDGELRNLARELEKVKSNNPNQARLCQEAFIALGKAMIGELSEAQIGQMSIEELMAQIYGIPIKLKTKFNVRIDQIVTLPKDTITELIKDFAQGCDNIRDILQNDPKKGRFEKHGLSYYWVELKDLPGFYSVSAYN